jgi:signal transduction histidine kinase
VTAPPAPITVLLVEDNPGDAELLVELLRESAPARAGQEAAAAPPERVLCAGRLAAAREMLRDGAVDVVLLDLSLPDARGLDTLAQVRAAAPRLPVVVLTGLADEGVAVQALQAGAQDYLVKGAVTGVGVRRAIRHALERQRLLDAAQRATHARDTVLGVVAHDLRNPLATIRMCARALGVRAASPDAPAEPDGDELHGVILRSVEWMERIIGDLLDVSRLDAGHLAMDAQPVEPAALLDALRELHAPLAEERHVTLEVRAAGALPVVHADPDRLLQALGNLLGNALKFTPAGGRITVDAAAGPSSSDTPDRPHVRFAVTDTGAGIPGEHLPHIFDRFWQARETRRAGAGLGLAIVKGIAEAHGGAVRVRSTVGVGSTFEIEIPVGP